MIADISGAVLRKVVVINGVLDGDRGGIQVREGGETALIPGTTDLAAAFPDPGKTFLCYMNADARFVAPLENMRGFHVVRDPRDVVVSAYFSHLHSHPIHGKLGEHRETLKSISESEGLMLELEGRVHQFRAMSDWNYDDPRILELRTEEVTVDAATYLPKIFEFLGLGPKQGLSPKLIAEVVENRDFSKLAGRPLGEEDETHHYRKGVAGDWKNHFGPEHIEYFKAHYNDLLLMLGYETTEDWG
jgi:hypothetical protein